MFVWKYTSHWFGRTELETNDTVSTTDKVLYAPDPNISPVSILKLETEFVRNIHEHGTGVL